MRNSIVVTRFCTLSRDFTLNREFTLLYIDPHSFNRRIFVSFSLVKLENSFLRKEKREKWNFSPKVIFGQWAYVLQRFSEVPYQLGVAIFSVIPGNPLLWTFLM